MVWQPKKLCDSCIKLNICKKGKAGKEACKNYKYYSLPVVPKHGSNIKKGNNMEEIIGTPNKKVKVIIEDDNKMTTYFCGGEICINQPRIDTPYKEINKTFNLHNKIGKNFSFTSTEVTITEQDKKEEINSMKCMRCGKEMRNTIGGCYTCDSCGFGLNDCVLRYKTDTPSNLAATPIVDNNINTPGLNSNGRQGWICPKCGASLSPDLNACIFCRSGKGSTISYTTAIGKSTANTTISSEG